MGLTDAELAIAAAQAGAAIVRAKYGESLVRFEKSATDFATDADLEAEQAILGILNGERAFVRRTGTDRPLSASAESHLVDVNLDAPFPNAPTVRAVRLLADQRFSDLFRPRVVSTSLAVAWVAAGRRAG